MSRVTCCAPAGGARFRPLSLRTPCHARTPVPPPPRAADSSKFAVKQELAAYGVGTLEG